MANVPTWSYDTIVRRHERTIMSDSCPKFQPYFQKFARLSNNIQNISDVHYGGENDSWVADFRKHMVSIRNHDKSATGYPSSLPKDDEALVNNAFAEEDFLLRVGNIPVDKEDFCRLKPTIWLNDEVINAYILLIQARANLAAQPSDWSMRSSPLRVSRVEHNLLCHSSFLYQKLITVGYEEGKLDTWTRKVNMFSLDRVLIPINHGNKHWTAASINFVEKRIESYDSWSTSKSHRVFKVLRGYLDAEHQRKRLQPFNFEGWTDYTHPNQPLQQNGYDCGIFVCATLEALSRGEDEFYFDQSNMPYLRQKIAWEILNGSLKVDG